MKDLFKRGRSLKRGLPNGKIPVQVVAMVERVVKRQADLGVDIVTDGEVVFFFFKFQPPFCPRWEERDTTCTF